MSKKGKKEKQSPNFIVFLVEGESDKIALENPLSELIFEKYPDYEVRFLLQQRIVNKFGDEVDDDNEDEDDGDPEDDGEEDSESYIEEEYVEGGDITTSSFVTPKNIVIKIENRFIKPATKAEGIYNRRIAKIIHIVDLDGAYVPDECVVPFSPERADCEKPFYDGERGIIEAKDVDAIRERNARKQANIDFLLTLCDEGIKIGSRVIPYEIYFFSSNMDHFINHDANLGSGKKHYADRFLREYGFDTEKFAAFFFNDPASIGHLGYDESWNAIRDQNSVMRHTNIDCLIKRLLDRD